MPPPTLHPLQQQALESLDWLHSQREVDRRTGRSTVQALHYLRRLVRGDTDQNGRVYIDDHSDIRGGDTHLLHAIVRIAEEFGIQVRVTVPRTITLHNTERPSPEAVDALLNLVSQPGKR